MDITGLLIPVSVPTSQPGNKILIAQPFRDDHPSRPRRHTSFIITEQLQAPRHLPKSLRSQPNSAMVAGHTRGLFRLCQRPSCI